MQHIKPSPRRARLYEFLRQAAQIFIAETETEKPSSQRESVSLRNEVDCTFLLLKEGRLDSEQLVRELPDESAGDPADAALTGSSAR